MSIVLKDCRGRLPWAILIQESFCIEKPDRQRRRLNTARQMPNNVCEYEPFDEQIRYGVQSDSVDFARALAIET